MLTRATSVAAIQPIPIQAAILRHALRRRELGEFPVPTDVFIKTS